MYIYMYTEYIYAYVYVCIYIYKWGNCGKLLMNHRFCYCFFPSIFGQQRYESGGCKISMTTSYL